MKRDEGKQRQMGLLGWIPASSCLMRQQNYTGKEGNLLWKKRSFSLLPQFSPCISSTEIKWKYPHIQVHEHSRGFLKYQSVELFSCKIRHRIADNFFGLLQSPLTLKRTFQRKWNPTIQSALFQFLSPTLAY